MNPFSKCILHLISSIYTNKLKSLCIMNCLGPAKLHFFFVYQIYGKLKISVFVLSKINTHEIEKAVMFCTGKILGKLFLLPLIFIQI